ncbi:MAG: HNH endonuclease [Deltaproteobacteria bacterium]|nr:HNH endonuclease [Deltaproteobacteria bacterium]
MKIQELHRCALEAARKLFQAEAELLDLIQRIDACKGFRDLGHASLFSYVVDGLKFSESTALNLIGVARKAVKVPALKTEIQAGNLSVCKARKIVPVLNVQNQAEWIEKVKKLPTRMLEREIAKVAPTAAFPERVRYATENRLNVSLSVDEKTMQAIRRVQDLECQRQGRPVTLEEALAAMSACYIEKNDPVEKAKRAAAKSEKVVVKASRAPATSQARVIAKAGLERTDVTVTYGHALGTRRRRETAYDKNKTEKTDVSAGTRRPIPARVEHQVALRDGVRCTAIDRKGMRCESGRWVHVHHLRPVSLGGQNTLENLTTLCSAHHQIRHTSEMRHMKVWAQFEKP